MLLTFAWYVNICWIKLLKTSINNTPSSKNLSLLVFIKTKKQRKKKGEAETSSNMRPHETFQGQFSARPPPPLRKDLRKNTISELRVLSEHPDLDAHDLSVYFSRNQFCEGIEERE